MIDYGCGYGYSTLAFALLVSYKLFILNIGWLIDKKLWIKDTDNRNRYSLRVHWKSYNEFLKIQEEY